MVRGRGDRFSEDGCSKNPTWLDIFHGGRGVKVMRGQDYLYTNSLECRDDDFIGGRGVEAIYRIKDATIMRLPLVSVSVALNRQSAMKGTSRREALFSLAYRLRRQATIRALSFCAKLNRRSSSCGYS